MDIQFVKENISYRSNICVEDDIVINNSNSCEPTLNNSHNDATFSISFLSVHKDSTDSEDITKWIEHYLKKFRENESYFTYVLTHSWFEDGMDNDAKALLKNYFKISSYTAILWFISYFNSNIKDGNVTYRLLRCISSRYYIKHSTSLISLVRGCLNDKNLEVQEAAFMVLESWRTKECLDVIESTKFVNPLIESYVEELKLELTSELC